MDPPHQFGPSAGRLLADLEVLHDGVVVQSVLWRPSVFELREHGRGGHRGNTSANCCHTIPRLSTGPCLWTPEVSHNTVSPADDRPILFTLSCSEREIDRWGRHCSKAEYAFLYFQIFYGFSVILKEILTALLFILKIFCNVSSFTSEIMNQITMVPIRYRRPFTQSHAYPNMTSCK